MKILYLYANLQGTGHYRCIYPGRALERLGHTVHFTDRIETWSENHLPVDLSYDIYVFQLSQDEAVLRCMRALRNTPRVCIYEVDDYYHAIPFYNPSSRNFRENSGYKLEMMERCMREADAVTVTTPELAEKYSRYNELVFPLPNCIDHEDPIWSRKMSPGGEDVVVGWAGSPTHLEDFRMVVSSLERLCRRYPHVKVAVGGPEDVFALLDGIPENQKIYLPPVGFNDYPGMLARFDIGLVPLVDNEFNRCKSDLKGLEYSCLGIPFLASPLPSYKRLVVEGENGFLCSSPREWYGRLCFLVENPATRKKMGCRAREIAAGKMVNEIAFLWEGIYMTLVTRKQLAAVAGSPP
jgi:glycosyltransferase involved in cell wall biosynthesis